MNNNSMEELVYNQFLKDLVYEENGKQYINESKLDQFDSNELVFAHKILQKRGINVKPKLTTKEDRASIVKDHEYGNIIDTDLEELDSPVFTNEIGEVDYYKLQEFLDNEFLPNNLTIIKEKANQQNFENDIMNAIKEFEFKIQGNKIAKLRLSELEEEFVMDYLKQLHITVCGIDESLEEFENYNYITTNKNRKLNQPPAISKEETKKLLIEYENSLDRNQKIILRNKIIEGNYALINWVIYKWYRNSEIDKHILESYAVEGLINAIERYNSKIGEFSTYAVIWIRAKIQRGIPVEKGYQPHQNKLLKKYEQIVKYNAEHGKIYENKSDEVRDIVDTLIKMGAIPKYEKNVYTNLFLMNNAENLNEMILNNPNELIDSDTNENKIFSQATFSLFKDILDNALNKLRPIEQAIIRYRFGFDDGEVKTLEEAAQKFHATKEDIHIVETRALRKLRVYKTSKQLVDYVGEYGEPDTTDYYEGKNK